MYTATNIETIRGLLASILNPFFMIRNTFAVYHKMLMTTEQELREAHEACFGDNWEVDSPFRFILAEVQSLRYEMECGTESAQNGLYYLDKIAKLASLADFICEDGHTPEDYELKLEESANIFYAE